MIRPCQLTIPGLPTPLDFRFFEASQGHVAGILEGKTYPHVPDIGSVRTIVDIGANVGAASLALCARYVNAVVHAFEPGPAPCELLRANTESLGRIRVYPYGIHDHDGVVKLFRSRWDSMSASIAASAENTEEYDEISLRSAQAVANECALDVIDVLKIDTEGCELPILQAWRDRLAAVRILYLEYHSDDDRRAIDDLPGPTHVLAHAEIRHPHRGDVTYVARDTDFARRASALAIGPT